MTIPAQLDLTLSEAIEHVRALLDKGSYAEAESVCVSVLRQVSASDELSEMLAFVLRRQGRWHKAALTARRALKKSPDHLPLYVEAGLAIRETGDNLAAEECMREAVARDPSFVPGWYHLGRWLGEGDDTEAAVAALQRVVEFDPAYASALGHLGVALTKANRLEEATDVMLRGIALHPDDADMCSNLAQVLDRLGRRNEGIAVCETFLSAHPGPQVGVEDTLAKLRTHDAMISLRQGDFDTGWREYRWRFKTQALRSTLIGDIPEWDGTPLSGRTLLVYREQGLGDFIQFCRYVPLIDPQRSGRVLMLGRPELRRLLETLDGAELVEEQGERIDMQIPIMNLPEAFGTRLDTIPNQVPYLRVEPELVATWRDRLSGDGFKVGLVWAGNPGYVNDKQRSCDLGTLIGPLRSVPGVRLFSLQVGQRREALEGPEGEGIVDLAPDLTDFAETAAALCCLDLVICVDTSVAHLAGALARPVWIMLPFAADWRWLEGREDSPWYPTARLFRQRAGEGDWRGVSARLGQALLELIPAQG